jgi:hypothetical protein
MDPNQKIAQLLLRLVATGLILIGGLVLGLELLEHRLRQVELSWVKVGFHAVLVLAGLILLALSARLAARFAGGDDEDADEPPPDDLAS